VPTTTALEEFDFADGVMLLATNVLEHKPPPTFRASPQETHVGAFRHDWLVGHGFSYFGLKRSGHGYGEIRDSTQSLNKTRHSIGVTTNLNAVGGTADGKMSESIHAPTAARAVATSNARTLN
jgi:hypothetical protein